MSREDNPNFFIKFAVIYKNASHNAYKKHQMASIHRQMEDINPEEDISTAQRGRKGVPKLWMAFAGILICMVAAILLILRYDTNNHTIEDREKHPNSGANEGSVSGIVEGHEWIDLGLPSGLKWAICNVGANAPEECGDYYAWGETETKNEYTTDNCLTHRVDLKKLIISGITDADGNLTAKSDVASQEWGPNWRIPTDAEYQELVEKCKWEFTTYNGAQGYLVTGPNHQTIFIIAAGYRLDGTTEHVGEYGDYWSATAVKELTTIACSMGYSPHTYGRRCYARYRGRSIRPVLNQ